MKPTASEWKRLLGVTEAGDPCRHCGAPVTRKERSTPPKQVHKGRKRRYYFEWWFRCPDSKCGAIYMVEAAKRYYPGEKPRRSEVAPEDLETRKPSLKRPRTIPEGVPDGNFVTEQDPDDDGRLPW